MDKKEALRILISDYSSGRKITQASFSRWKRCAKELGIEIADMFEVLGVSTVYLDNNGIKY